MSGTRAAIRYAKAVLSLANDQNSAEAVNNDMKLIAKTIAESIVVEKPKKNRILVGVDKSRPGIK